MVNGGQAGVREAIAMTYELERIWNVSAVSASDADDQLGNSVLYRYVGTREGVYRVFPAIRIPLKYDPTQQPWSVAVTVSYSLSINQSINHVYFRQLGP